MRLSYIAPTLKQGKKTACLLKNEVESEAKKWAKAIFLYVIGDTPSIHFVSTFIEKQ